MTDKSSARLNMRIDPEALQTIRDAAAAEQQDMTSFVLGAALDRAREVLVADRITRLTASEARSLEAALGRDAQAVAEIVALIRRAREKRVASVKQASSGVRVD